MNGELAAALLGLFSGGFWGTGDFFGGLASRRISAYSIVFYGQIAGSLALLIVTLLIRDSLPSSGDLLLGCAAGIFYSLGLLLSYSAMSVDKISVVAPVTAVLGAFFPVIVGFTVHGVPEWIQVGGIATAIVAILLISHEGCAVVHHASLRLPLLAGLSYGMYLTLIAAAAGTSVFWPILSGRVASIALIGYFGRRCGALPRPTRASFPAIAASGLFDTVGETLFAFSAVFGRLDIATILVSLYPAATVGLAWLVLKERLQHIQWIGVFLAALAVLLITI